jgi:hypothetical protein
MTITTEAVPIRQVPATATARRVAAATVTTKNSFAVSVEAITDALTTKQ